MKTFLRGLAATALAGPRRARGGAALPEGAALTRARIAVLKPDAIGDFILSTLALRFLEEKLPGARFTLFCREPVGALARDQFPKWEVVELPKKRKPLRTLWDERATLRGIGAGAPFDLLVNLRFTRDMSDSALANWIPAHAKLALENHYPAHLAWARLPGEEHFFDAVIAPPAPRAGESVELAGMRAMAAAVLPGYAAEAFTRWPRLIPRPAALLAAKKLAADAGLDAGEFDLVCPGAGDPIRQYPVASLAAALEAVPENERKPLVLAGSVQERGLTGELAAALGGRQRVVDVAGKTTLGEHIALMSLARSVLCMETSHAHIAAALDMAGVVIVGGGHFGLFGPWGAGAKLRWVTHALPCFECHWCCIYSQPHCIRDIPPEVMAREWVAARAGAQSPSGPG